MYIVHIPVHWNLWNPDTFGTEESVLSSEMSGVKLWHLGQLKVSCLSRCPHFSVS